MPCGRPRCQVASGSIPVRSRCGGDVRIRLAARPGRPVATYWLATQPATNQVWTAVPWCVQVLERSTAHLAHLLHSCRATVPLHRRHNQRSTSRIRHRLLHPIFDHQVSKLSTWYFAVPLPSHAARARRDEQAADRQRARDDRDRELVVVRREVVRYAAAAPRRVVVARDVGRAHAPRRVVVRNRWAIGERFV